LAKLTDFSLVLCCYSNVSYIGSGICWSRRFPLFKFWMVNIENCVWLSLTPKIVRTYKQFLLTYSMQNVLHCNSEQRSSVSNHEQCSLSEYNHVRCEVPCYEGTAELNIRYSAFGLY